MAELDDLLSVLKETGGDRAILADRLSAHAVVDGSRILSLNEVPGLALHAREKEEGIEAQIVVGEGVKIERPVHLCFGVLQATGNQDIVIDLRMETGASAHFLAHCLFPGAQRVRHRMQARIEIGQGAELRYTEAHFHGPYGGIEVLPKTEVRVGENGRFLSEFTLTSGRVGRLDLDLVVEAAENAVAELTARIFGHADDEIKVREKIVLRGANSRGLIKSRIALDGDATAEVTGITEGHAAGARGHVDCMELVRERAVGRAIPIVQVTHPLAKVTHEAAIGSVDQQQLETLMAHGLTPEEAVDVIIKGILR
ncbi:MAG: SufD family Fe-S cluster assembly protein [Desulfuromonadales bacterium]|nr:SufD family Fe-S cluster assembly protein [Desulfuromonadales bacterium]